ncbi:MAG: phosphoglucosamine mutase [bacterium]
MAETSPAGKTLMAGVSGVRGIVGAGLDPVVAADYAAAYARLCAPGPILLARDPRRSGTMIRQAVLSGLLASGRRVIDLGIVPTPTLLLNTPALEAAGGIMITASHNPVEWNGLKFADPAGRYLAPEDSHLLIGDASSGVRSWVRWDELGELEVDWEGGLRHTGRAAAAPGVDLEAVAGAGLVAAVDGCGGAGSEILPDFLEENGVEVHRIHCGMDGTFPRPPEPSADALGDLGAEVRDRGAHLGLALDPDADRLALVGPDGLPLGEELTLALAARQVLGVRPGPVAANLSTSRMLDDVCGEAGVELVRTPVGEINVVEGMLEASAVIGGEGNGGVIHPDVVLGRDALTASALVLSALARAGGDLETLRSGIPVYAMIKRKLPLPGEGAESFGERLREAAADFEDARVDTRDGLRVDWEDRWVHVRPSNTEPIARLIAEAPTPEEAEETGRMAAERFGMEVT